MLVKHSKVFQETLADLIKPLGYIYKVSVFHFALHHQRFFDITIVILLNTQGHFWFSILLKVLS